MFVIEPLRLNSTFKEVQMPSRSELFKRSTFNGFKYKQEASDVSLDEHVEFRHLDKNEQFLRGQEYVESDIGKQALEEARKALNDKK